MAGTLRETWPRRVGAKAGNTGFVDNGGARRHYPLEPASPCRPSRAPHRPKGHACRTPPARCCRSGPRSLEVSIGRIVVDHDDSTVEVGLLQHTVRRATNHVGTVVRRDDYTDFGTGHLSVGSRSLRQGIAAGWAVLGAEHKCARVSASGDLAAGTLCYRRASSW